LGGWWWVGWVVVGEWGGWWWQVFSRAGRMPDAPMGGHIATM
jgi:hypothetical protein